MLRTHTCGELTRKHEKKEVTLCGWVHARRDHGGVIFIDLRDRYGLTQIVFDPRHNKDTHALAEKLRREDVIQTHGTARYRGKGLENPKLATGDIEILIDHVHVLNKSDMPPLEIDDTIDASEDNRLKYRYLDLRRPKMQHRLRTRHNIIMAARDYFNQQGFLEVQTPLLVKSTPEGARDYVVPSRVNKGKFYALPQSPQLYKQLLMVAGCDRYYQIAPCLRDEDLRADRQPEHYQFDLEMSFVEQQDIRDFVENLIKQIVKTIHNITLPKFPVISYHDAMNTYGSDKPDLRFDLTLVDVSHILKKSHFSIFKETIANGGTVKCITVNHEFSRKDLDKYIEFCQHLGAKGMAWIRHTPQGLESSIVKYLDKDVQQELINSTKTTPGSTIMFIADTWKKTNTLLGQLRLQLANDLNLIPKNEFKFCWVNDFPLFSYNDTEDRWEPEHHMFTMPKPEYVECFEQKPGETIGDLWDLVVNGWEIGSGSIRITRPDVQERIMSFIGLNKQATHDKFGFLLDAYKYGGPPHGGMGLGVDRFCALMLGVPDIREVIAFPKNKQAQCPMDGSPSDITTEQLRELHLRVDIVKNK